MQKRPAQDEGDKKGPAQKRDKLWEDEYRAEIDHVCRVLTPPPAKELKMGEYEVELKLMKYIGRGAKSGVGKDTWLAIKSWMEQAVPNKTCIPNHTVDLIYQGGTRVSYHMRTGKFKECRIKHRVDNAQWQSAALKMAVKCSGSIETVVVPPRTIDPESSCPPVGEEPEVAGWRPQCRRGKRRWTYTLTDQERPMWQLDLTYLPVDDQCEVELEFDQSIWKLTPEERRRHAARALRWFGDVITASGQRAKIHPPSHALLDIE